jgi:ABC-type transport system substrate-binding protein
MFVGRAQESTWTEGFGVESVGSGSAGTYLITAHKSGVASGRPYHYFFYNNSVIGTILQTGTTGVAYNTSSDYRLKENVVYDWDATTRLKQLKPARFNFITEADRTVDGFLAHEAQAVVPEAVHGTHNEVDDDGAAVMQGIDQSKLVPLLVKTIQELEARITALEDV